MAEPEAAAREAEARHVASVRRYYDENTSLFVRFGQGKGSIHRAVWGPGVGTRDAAMHYVDDIVLRELRRLPATMPGEASRDPLLLDLGCGVGASLLYVASRTPVIGRGITLSPVQCEQANQAFASAGIAGRVHAEVGDFHELDPALTEVDVAIAIEAFVQSANAERFFSSAARALKPHGRLLLCDDFLQRSELSGAEAQQVEAFRVGWRIGALFRVDEAAAIAKRAGLRLIENLDLTPHLELGRPRDRVIAFALKLGRLLKLDGAYVSSLEGGNALQLALKSGALAYRVLVFERQDDGGG